MPNDSTIVGGDYTIASQGAATISAEGDGIYLHAAGSDGVWMTTAEKMATINCGGRSMLTLMDDGKIAIAGSTTGSITQAVGVAAAPSQIVIEPAKLALSCGPLGVGASIELTPEGITAKYALWSLEINASGISLSVGPSSVKVTPAGVDISGLNVNVKGEAMATVQGTAMACLKASGIVQVQGALAKVN